jgi:hypothetical protein
MDIYKKRSFQNYLTKTAKETGARKFARDTEG